MRRPDSIEREIAIDAPRDEVWPLVTEPGWWIGDGDFSGQRRWREDDHHVVDDPTYGRYVIETVSVEPNERISFRCAFGFPGEVPDETNSTLIEFELSDASGGTLVRVVESGIATLARAQGWGDEAWARYVAGNTGGWEEQLDVLRRSATEVTA